jgi:hypothetical protein
LQAIGIVAVAVSALAALVFYSLTFVVLLCLVTAIASGLAKLAVDATIQERVPETVRASAFAHSETLLMLAWVLGGALGLIPFTGRIGMALCAIGMAVAAARAATVAMQLRNERLSGISSDSTVAMAAPAPSRPQPQPQPSNATTQDLAPAAPKTVRVRPFRTLAQPLPGTTPETTKARAGRWSRRKAAVDPPKGAELPKTKVEPVRTDVLPPGPEDQPSYHLYRPTTLDERE